MSRLDNWLSQFLHSNNYDDWVREGCEKKPRKKCGLLPNSPRTPPPPQFGIFSKKKFTPIFFENCIFNGRKKVSDRAAPSDKALEADVLLSQLDRPYSSPLIGTYHKQLPPIVFQFKPDRQRNQIPSWIQVQTQKQIQIRYKYKSTATVWVCVKWVCVRICWICWPESVENSFAFVGWSLYPDTHSVPMMTRYILLYQIPQIFQIWRFTQIHPKHFQ